MKQSKFSVVFFINFGAPDLKQSQEMLRFYASEGVRHLQLDLPARDTYLENDFVAGRMAQALAACDDMGRYLAAIEEIKEELPFLSVEMTLYEESLRSVGVEAFLAFCKKLGIKRVSLLPDRKRPDPKLLERLRDGGLSLLHAMPFYLPQDIIDEAVRWKEPVVLMLEHDGSHPLRPGCETLRGALDFLRAQGVKGPLYTNMGIRTPERLEEIREEGADGGYVGSRLMQVWDDKQKLRNLLRAFAQVGC